MQSCSFRVLRLSKMWCLLQASSALQLTIEQSAHFFLSIYIGIAALNSVFTLVSAPVTCMPASYPICTGSNLWMHQRIDSKRACTSPRLWLLSAFCIGMRIVESASSADASVIDRFGHSPSLPGG